MATYLTTLIRLAERDLTYHFKGDACGKESGQRIFSFTGVGRNTYQGHSVSVDGVKVMEEFNKKALEELEFQVNKFTAAKTHREKITVLKDWNFGLEANGSKFTPRMEAIMSQNKDFYKCPHCKAKQGWYRKFKDNYLPFGIISSVLTWPAIFGAIMIAIKTHLNGWLLVLAALFLTLGVPNLVYVLIYNKNFKKKQDELEKSGMVETPEFILSEAVRMT